MKHIKDVHGSKEMAVPVFFNKGRFEKTSKNLQKPLDKTLVL